MERKNTFVLTHSQSSGYNFGCDYSSVVSDSSVQKWINSYLSMLTSYASNPKYIAEQFVSNSFFTKDNYAIFTRSYPRRDTRTYLESKIIIENLNEHSLSFNALTTNLQNIQYLKSDSIFTKHLMKAFIMSLVADNITLYCLCNNDSDIQGLRSLYFSLDYGLVTSGSCVEAVADLPTVKPSVMLCRCIFPEDKVRFTGKILEKSNYILLDLTDATPKLDFKIGYPTYAQSVVDVCFNSFEYNKVYPSFIKMINRCNTIKNQCDKVTFYNLAAYSLLKQCCPSYLTTISATQQEKTEIEKIIAMENGLF